MDTPPKETFKISLLEGFVVMLTLSILLSLDVYVFQAPEERLDLGVWWRSSSSFDGLGILVIFHAFVVIMVVVTMRSLQTLWKKRGQDV